MARAADPAVWDDALAVEGRLGVGYRRLRTTALAVLAGSFAVAGVLVAATADSRGDRVLGVVTTLLFGAVTLSLLRRLLGAASVVEVTAEGVRSVPGGWTLPWSGLRGVSVRSNHGNQIVCLVVDPTWQQTRTTAGTRAERARAAAHRRLSGGHDVVTLPFPLAVDEEAFAAWLVRRADAARHQG